MLPLIGLLVANYVAVRLLHIVLRREQYHNRAAMATMYVVASAAFLFNLLLAAFLLLSGTSASDALSNF